MSRKRKNYRGMPASFKQLFDVQEYFEEAKEEYKKLSSAIKKMLIHEQKDKSNEEPA